MGENWHKYAIDEIEQSGRKLTPWEEDFVFGRNHCEPGIKKRILMGLSLTEKQEAVLLKIHQRVTDCCLGVRG